MTIPEVLVARLQAGEMQAPSLREIQEADGARYAVLDFMVVVPVSPSGEWEACQHVLGFDWGVRKLVTASVVDLDGHQIGRPFFLDTGPFDGRQARLRRQIDLLKAKVTTLEHQRDRFPVGDHEAQASRRCLARAPPGDQSMLAQVRGQKQRSGPSGGQPPPGPGDGL